ncbi:MAG: MarR family transcriptional regulator, partial [Aliifodinibius sp.]|nr:MarR family transcriptional regulator [Fodinibius sp.]NIV14107.1 MarR family transcriptional regulator [Fodinibius sp.]NIY27922.1 MarR family transcriptional regulator [Fodinibius sp.]
MRRFERLNQILNNSCCKGVTMAQCHALLEIEELGEAITIQLAKNLLLDKSTLSRTVDNLVKRGLVERKQHPTDRRYTTLFLTDKGVRICDEINRANDDTYEKILSELPSNEIQKIMENFEQLVKILNNSNRNAN